MTTHIGSTHCPGMCSCNKLKEDLQLDALKGVYFEIPMGIYFAIWAGFTVSWYKDNALVLSMGF